MKLLVAGGTGIIGRAIAQVASSAGIEVTTCARNPLPPGAPRRALRHEICNRQDYDAFAGMVRRLKPDVVIDLACFSAVDAWSAVEACAGVSRYVFCSSVAVYGVQPGRVNERFATACARPYGKGKVAAEDVLRTAAAVGRLESLVARMSIVFGPGGQLPRQTSDLRPWVHRVRRSEPVLIVDGGRARGQLLYAVDAAQALLRLSMEVRDPFRIFTVAPPDAVTWHDFHVLVARCVDREPRFASASMAELVACDPVQFDECDELSGHDVVFDTLSLQTAIPGWYPRVPMDEAIRHTIDALNEVEPTIDLEGQLISMLSRHGRG